MQSTFTNESTARDMVARGDKIGAIRLLRDFNPFLSLVDAKNVVESWGSGDEITADRMRVKLLAYHLALEYYKGKLSSLDLDARTANVMECAAAKENAERMFMGTAGELLDKLTAGEPIARES